MIWKVSCADFGGGHGDEKKKICWISWKRLCQPKSWGGMGFRGLRSFNTALLAKQVWQLLHAKQSLFYKVFHAKFFPTGSILDAKENSRGSYAWASILKARQVIRDGLWWRVGDGTDIKVWGDNWLTEPHLPRLISPCPATYRDLLVTALIDPVNHVWNLQEIEPLLFPFEVAGIYHIPLSLLGAKDTMIWHASQDGRFSVCSAYRLLVSAEVSSNSSNSTNEAIYSFWKSIWSLAAPPKVRNFLWRACSEALPTKLNLCKRSVLRDPLCDQCQEGVEDSLHALWLCPIVALVWQSEPRLGQYLTTPFLNFMDIVAHIFAKGTTNDATLFGFLAWSLWMVQNKKRLQQSGNGLENIHQRVLAMVSEFNASTELKIPRGVSNPTTDCYPPPSGCYKVNYNGAVFSATKEAGLGIIICDDRGLPMVSFSQKVPFTGSSGAVEAMALRRALLLALEMGFFSIILEGDSETLVKECNISKTY